MYERWARKSHTHNEWFIFQLHFYLCEVKRRPHKYTLLTFALITWTDFILAYFFFSVAVVLLFFRFDYGRPHIHNEFFVYLFFHFNPRQWSLVYIFRFARFFVVWPIFNHRCGWVKCTICVMHTIIIIIIHETFAEIQFSDFRCIFLCRYLSIFMIFFHNYYSSGLRPEWHSFEILMQVVFFWGIHLLSRMLNVDTITYYI